jgi:SepF-like predicted cell division protein (DUF552 family)
MGLFSRKKDFTQSLEPHQPDLTKNTNLNHTFKQLFIKRINLGSSGDFTMLKQNLMEGHIMIVDLSPLVNLSQSPVGDQKILHNNLQLIKQYCVQNGGNVMKIKQNMIMITPNSKVKFQTNN